MKGLDPYDAAVNAKELYETAEHLLQHAPKAFSRDQIGAFNELLIRAAKYRQRSGEPASAVAADKTS
jgi:hypothetical protein